MKRRVVKKASRLRCRDRSKLGNVFANLSCLTRASLRLSLA